MNCYLRQIFALFILILLTANNISFAMGKEIKYSIGPKCNENTVVCGQNEVPVCLVFEPTIHLVSTGGTELLEDAEYLPSCTLEMHPNCVDKSSGATAPNNVVLECIEFVQCNDNIAHCSDGKTAKCLGDNSELNGCNCNNGSDPVCDYTWQVSSEGSYN